MTKIIQRHDTAANWTAANPVLAAGEMGVETDTSKFKFGDGSTVWSELAYAGGGSSVELVPATADTLGGIKVGENLSITKDGTLSAGTEVFNKDAFNIVGSPAITEEGVSSGFSSANYVQIPMPDLSTATTWTIQGKFSFGGALDSTEQSLFSSSATYRVIGVSICKGSTSANAGKIGFNIGTESSWIDGGNTTSSLTLNNSYYFKLVFTGSSYQLFISTDDITYTKEIDFASSVKLSYDSSYNFNIGMNRDASIAPWLGTIDLSKFKIIADGVTVFSGSKFVLPGSAGSGTQLTSADGATEYGELALGDTLAVADGVLNANLDTKQDKLTAKVPLKIAIGDIKELNNLEIVYPSGYSLTDDLIFSINSNNTSAGAYLRTTSRIPCQTASNWSIVVRTKLSDKQPLFYSNSPQAGFYFATNVICLSTNDRIWQYTYNPSLSSIVGTIVYIKYEYTGSSYVVAYSTDNVTYTNIKVFSTSNKIPHNVQVGIAHSASSSSYYDGEIYLNDSYYTVNGVKYPFGIGVEKTIISSDTATSSSLGVVQPDGTTITVNEAGIISGQDVKTFTGYSDTGTLVLKSINGVLQWVAEG